MNLSLVCVKLEDAAVTLLHRVLDEVVEIGAAYAERAVHAIQRLVHLPHAPGRHIVQDDRQNRLCRYGRVPEVVGLLLQRELLFRKLIFQRVGLAGLQLPHAVVLPFRVNQQKLPPAHQIHDPCPDHVAVAGRCLAVHIFRQSEAECGYLVVVQLYLDVIGTTQDPNGCAVQIFQDQNSRILQVDLGKINDQSYAPFFMMWGGGESPAPSVTIVSAAHRSAY